MTVHRLPLPVPGAPPINPFVKGEVRELLTAGNFDVAHGHMGVVSPFATDMIGVAVDVGLPTVATWHCVIDRSAPIFRALGHARRWGEAGVALSAVSAMAAERVAAIAGGADVHVLGNGIDVDSWRPTGLAVGRARDDGVVRVVSAMRFVRRKRPGALVDVLRAAREQLDRSAPGVRLEADLVGDGPQRRLIAAQLERHGIDWIHLPGRVSREQLRDLHWRSDVYLTTARLEAFGIAALEARTAGPGRRRPAGHGSGGLRHGRAQRHTPRVPTPTSPPDSRSSRPIPQDSPSCGRTTSAPRPRSRGRASSRRPWLSTRAPSGARRDRHRCAAGESRGRHASPWPTGLTLRPSLRRSAGRAGGVCDAQLIAMTSTIAYAVEPAAAASAPAVECRATTTSAPRIWRMSFPTNALRRMPSCAAPVVSS